MQIIPGLCEKDEAEGAADEGAEEGPGSFFGDGQLFADAFGTVVDAYMLFDTDASGTIDRCAGAAPAAPAPVDPRDTSLRGGAGTRWWR